MQKPDAKNTLDFFAANRETKTQKDNKVKKRMVARKNATAMETPRKIINLTVALDSLSDRTRIVVNPEKSESYEMDCDAAKFVADDMPQIYSTDNEGATYSINERCIGNGLVGLVVKSPKDGVCTISASRLDCAAKLRDLDAGVEVDLAEEGYSFLAEAATYSNRFVIVLSDKATGISDCENLDDIISVQDGCIVIAGTDKAVSVYTLGGALVASQKGSGRMAVANGSYVVKIGSMSKKVVVNK